MTITVIVHALEAFLCVLIVALGYRVLRQYKHDCSAAESFVPVVSREDLPAEVKTSGVGAAGAAHLGTAAVSNDDSIAVKPSSILDDYIGGFFDEAGVVDSGVKSFRAVEEKEVDTLFEAVGNDVSGIDASSDSANDVVEPIDLSEFKAVSEAVDDIPVLEARIPESLVTERFIAQVQELDSEVILVEDSEPVLASDSVMSDKVVLAMLDEAKLVSTS